MHGGLFHLSFEKWGIFLLLILPAFINIGIFIYTSFFLTRNKINNFFSIFVIILALSQVTDGLIRMSVAEETAYLWNKISIFVLILALSFGLLFALHFTKWYKKMHYAFLNLLLFLPPIFLGFLMIAHLDEYTIVKSESWNWIVNPESTLVTVIIYLWISVISLITLTILWIYYLKEKTKRIKRIQALLLALGYTVPVIAGIGLEVIFPLVLGIDDVPITRPLITAFSITSLIAIKKYQLFDYSPKHQWNKIIEQMNEGILIVDNSDKIMYANKTFCRFVEYEFSEIQGKTANELFIEHPEHKKQIEEAINQRKHKRSSQYEVQVKTKSEKKIWMLLNGSPYLDSKGYVIGSIGILTNIDHLKKADTLIRESEKKYRDLFESNPLPMFVLDSHSFKFLYVNEAAVNHYGYSRQEFLNMTALEIRAKEDNEGFRNEMKRLAGITNPRSSGLRKHIKKDRTIIQVEIVSSSIVFDDKPARLVLIRDVTKKIKAEAQLKVMLKRLIQAQEVAHMGSWELNFATDKAIWSDEACEIYGLSHEENIQSFQSWLSFIHPEDLEYIKKTIEKSQADLSDSSMKHRIICKDGTIKFIHTISQFEFGTDGKPSSLFGICHDITESKKDEEKLKASNKELETFIYKASHDFRSPLASILGLIQISKLEIKDEASSKYFSIIDSLIQKLDFMLSEFVKSMAIKDTGKFNDEIDFRELIHKTLNKFQHIKEFSHLKISTDVSLSSPFFSSKFILGTIFQNLIENSIKYQNLDQQDSFLKINVSQHLKKIKITFVDNGIGIENSLQDKIFDMFYRANEQSKGSGLGLYLVKKGIEKLNGEIHVSSTLGKGTTFTILL